MRAGGASHACAGAPEAAGGRVTRRSAAPGGPRRAGPRWVRGGPGAPGGARKGLEGLGGRGLTLPVFPAGRVREMSGFDSFTTDFFQTGYSIDEQAQHYDYGGGGGGRAYGR